MKMSWRKIKKEGQKKIKKIIANEVAWFTIHEVCPEHEIIVVPESCGIEDSSSCSIVEGHGAPRKNSPFESAKHLSSSSKFDKLSTILKFRSINS